jgi:hypothetical protein
MEIKILVIHLIIALSGTIAHIFSKLASLEVRRNFSLSEWLGRNKYRTTFSILSTAIVMTVILPHDEVEGLTAFTIGYTIDSFMKNLTKTPKLKNPDEEG